MKITIKLTICALLFILSAFTMNAQTLEVVNSTRSNLELTLSIDEFNLQNDSRNDLEGQIIVLNGIFLPNQPGMPNLPVVSRYVAIPHGTNVSINVTNQITETIHNVDLMPAPELPLDNDNSPMRYYKDETVYSTNALFPANPIYASESTKIRDIDIVILSVTPFQYNPVTKDLIVTRKLNLEIAFEGGDGVLGGDPRYRSAAWDQIIRDMVINGNVLPDANYEQFIKEAVQNRDTGCEYLIITPDNEDFIQLADSIKLFRNQQGILTDVVTVSECGGNNQAAIRSYIMNAYNNWDIPVSAVLLLGDHNTDGTNGIVSYTMNNHPGGDGYNPYISDNKYGDMNGDHIPDVVIARITGRNYEEMYHMINKDLQYERHPYTNARFYDKPITAMGFQLERWFQLCSEVVNGFWEYGLGKHPVRANAIYEGTPGSRWSTAEYTNSVVNYFGPNGLDYIPQNMSHLTEWGANANDVNAAIDAGAFMIQHRDHGNAELWGEPSYSIGSISRLVNPDLTFVMSNNCLTGQFNYGGVNGTCFAEAFHRHQYGALGLVAATEVSYSFLNDVYVWGVYDNMWPDFMPDYGTSHPAGFIRPAFGNAAGKVYLQQSSWISWDDGREITYYLFHHHGDAYMTLYTEMPQELDITMLPVLTEGASQYEITATENATICLTSNGEIIGLAIATGEPQIIDVTPQNIGDEVLLTVTKQDYYRYTRNIAVIPSSGPYLIFSECEINDQNYNGQLDYNETSDLNITIHNVGFENIQNVNAELSSDSPYVEILSSSTSFSSLNPDETATGENVFTVKVIDGVPDQTKAIFHLTMDNGTYTFTDNFQLTLNAPVFEITKLVIRDADGNISDRLYKNQNSTLTYTIKNSGHSNSAEVLNTLLLDAPFIDYENNIVEIDGIDLNDSIDATFSLMVTNDAPDGAIIEDIVSVQSGAYNMEYSSEIPLGNCIENFETETLNTLFRWQNSGSYKWVRDDFDPYEGDYCFTSTSVSSGTNSKLSLAAEVEIEDVISFYYKGSVNADDQFKIQINTETIYLEGGPEWQYFEYPLKTGMNLIVWNFSRKSNADEGSASIDLIKLPPMHVIFDDVNEIISDDNNAITVYPNPGNNELNILSSDTNESKIQIFDFQGRMIIELDIADKTTTINTTDWASGLYLWKAGTRSGKWIKF